MDVRKTKHYYDVSAGDYVCTCEYCRNYVKEIRHTYPELAEYLGTIGIDIEKPFETMPIEPDESGNITYIGSQYVVLGDPSGFEETDISGVHIGIADSHPMTDLQEEHFVLEVSEVDLKWTIQQDTQKGNGA